jgi:hypothetical protein
MSLPKITFDGRLEGGQVTKAQITDRNAIYFKTKGYAVCEDVGILIVDTLRADDDAGEAWGYAGQGNLLGTMKSSSSTGPTSIHLEVPTNLSNLELYHSLSSGNSQESAFMILDEYPDETSNNIKKWEKNARQIEIVGLFLARHDDFRSKNLLSRLGMRPHFLGVYSKNFGKDCDCESG